MENEVVIHVKVKDDDVDRGFASVRSKTKKLGTDIAEEVGKTGAKIGAGIGESITEGVGKASSSVSPIMEKGFSSVRSKTKKLGTDIVEEVGRVGSKIGTQIGTHLFEGFGGAVKQFGSQGLTPIMLELAGVMSPILSSALAGAVIGGAGIGGVIGGVMLVKDDPRIVGALSGLSKTVMSGLKQDAQVFVTPVLRGLDTVRAAWTGLRPTIAGVFRDSSKFVAPLIDGVVGAVTKITHGFADMVHNAGPAVAALSDMFSRLGGAIGEVFTDLSKHSQEGAYAIHDLTDALVFLIEGTGKVIGAFSTMYGWIHSSYEATQRWIGAADDSSNATNKVSDSTKNASDHINEMAVASLGAKNGIQSLKEHLDELTTTARSLFDATTGAAEAIASVTKAAKENGKTLDANTEKGRANRTALSHLAEALKAQYDATVAANGAGRQADGVASRNRQSFISLAIQLGATKAAARQLADQILGIPVTHGTKIYANTHDAAGRLAALKDQLDAIHGKNVNVSVSVTGLERLNAAGNRIGGFKASGGIVGAASGMIGGGMTWTGEHGPELLDLPPGTRVHSNPDSMRLAGQGGKGGGPITINFVVDGKVLSQAVVEPMRNEIRSKAGGSVQTYLGRGNG